MTDQGDGFLELARRELTSAALSDALDGLGLNQQIMSSRVRPLNEDSILCGRARTGNYRDVYHAGDESDPYDMVIALVDGLQPGDVTVLACGQSGRIHPWGGTQAVAAAKRHAAGCVTDGLVRDVGQLRALGLPCFAAGYGAVKLRGRGRLVAIDVPVQCGGVWVSRGDLIFGDVDGVVVVPGAMVEEVVRRALDKAALEREMIEDLRRGVSIVEVYRRYGTL